jgi:hypothetical protein
MWKSSCVDIIDMPPEVCDELLRVGEYEHDDGTVVSMNEIKKYCRQDCISLNGIVRKFFGSLYQR